MSIFFLKTKNCIFASKSFFGVLSFDLFIHMFFFFFHNLGWFIVLSFYYFICFKLPLHENSCFKHLDTTPTRRASFLNLLLLDTCVDLSTSSSLSAPFSCISYVFHVLHFFFYSLCVHSNLFSCFSFRHMVPSSPHSLYVIFLSVFGPSFLAFYAL